MVLLWLAVAYPYFEFYYPLMVFFISFRFMEYLLTGKIFFHYFLVIVATGRRAVLSAILALLGLIICFAIAFYGGLK